MHRFSRYRFSDIETDAAGRRFLGERARFTYRDLPDNRIHTVSAGQKLHHVAQLYFGQMPRAGNLWWVVADFQPEPIMDPTLELEAGRALVVPSMRVVEELIFASSRRS